MPTCLNSGVLAPDWVALCSPPALAFSHGCTTTCGVQSAQMPFQALPRTDSVFRIFHTQNAATSGASAWRTGAAAQTGPSRDPPSPLSMLRTPTSQARTSCSGPRPEVLSAEGRRAARFQGRRLAVAVGPGRLALVPTSPLRAAGSSPTPGLWAASSKMPGNWLAHAFP